MKHKSLAVLIMGLTVLSSIFGTGQTEKKIQVAEISYMQISQEEAKMLMDMEKSYIILDVREQDEFNSGHIKGAVLMPYTKTEELAPQMLPDKTQLILVYCRSGRRSKIASQALAKMGYTNVKEFGGIITWKYEIEM